MYGSIRLYVSILAFKFENMMPRRRRPLLLAGGGQALHYAKTNKQDVSFIKIADHGYSLISICHPYHIPCTFIPQHAPVHPKLVVSRTCLIPMSECVKFLGTFVPQHAPVHPKLVGYLNPPTNLQYSYSWGELNAELNAKGHVVSHQR